METEFEILKDPRSESSIADLQAQYDFLISIRDKVTEMHKGIKDIRDVKKQISGLTNKIKDDDEYKDLVEEGKRISKALTEIEQTLYQTKNQSGQDPLNFPIRLNNKLAHLSSVAGRGDYRPTDQAIGVRDELNLQIDEQLNNMQKILETDVPNFNRMVRDKGVNAIFTDIAEPVN